ncbi:DinB family protein (plasmid) [Deinococcus sp. KNUC1210]|uniref:DinB family protein n=1 Tax=Deinococcus sp. KNUC1210 TaxID=2917691 RepID=UPI001EEFBE03|nr:DinB family protein [Deinococcus sp. KNUC1210]ULH17699.1 DinB family protein [Deinococcus sp. KNUC1210]
MTQTADQTLLGVVLDSWNRNNNILLNLLHTMSEAGLEARPMEGSPSLAAQFTHIRDVRLFFVSQTAPEFTEDLPDLFRQEDAEWQAERDAGQIEQMLRDSAETVTKVVQSRTEAGLPLSGAHVAYDHPLLLLQHLLWHEGYHVGQMMLALKASGRTLGEEQAMPLIWDLWRREW